MESPLLWKDAELDELLQGKARTTDVVDGIYGCGGTASMGVHHLGQPWHICGKCPCVRTCILWHLRLTPVALSGSPLLPAVKERLVGIQDEYKELDKVWFVASRLFEK